MPAAQYYTQLEGAFWAEGPKGPGEHGHYQQVDGAYLWAGAAVASAPWSPNGTAETFMAADLESSTTSFASTTAVTYSVYTGDCPSGISANGS